MLLLAMTAAAQTGAAGGTAAPATPPMQAPSAVGAEPQPIQTPKEREAERIKHLAVVNYRPYDQPSHKDQFFDYLNDSYGLPAMGRSVARAGISQYTAKPNSAWGTDFSGYMDRFASAYGANGISGNVRYGMETVFGEDLRYIPCHGCNWRHKVENALLAEVTARHDTNGHRFFTFTPEIATVSGPILANVLWTPGGSASAGLRSSRYYLAVSVGAHLFTEFVVERRHHDPPED